MISPYTRPQLIIRQTLDRIQPQEERTLHACVIGPQYDLFRFTNADEKALMRGTLFVENTNPDPDERQLIPYEGLRSFHVVDPNFVRLYGVSLEGQLWQADSHPIANPASLDLYDFQLVSLANPNKVRVVRRGAVITLTEAGGQLVSAVVTFKGSGYEVATTFEVPVVSATATGAGAVVRLTTNGLGEVVTVLVISPGSGYDDDVVFSAPSGEGINIGVDDDTLLVDLHGRPIRAGDIGYFTLDDATVRRQIRSIERETSVAHFGANDDMDDKKLKAVDLNPESTDEAIIGSQLAPANWDIMANHTSVGRIVVNAAGSYVTAPAITISDPIEIGGFLEWPTEQATAEAVLSGTSLDHINVTNPGAGYYKGALTSIIITNGGSGYVDENPPTFVIDPPAEGGIQATAEPYISLGVITGYNITEPGAGYVTIPEITIVGGSPGTGAEAVAVINIGAIKSVSVTAPGIGYDIDSTITAPYMNRVNSKTLDHTIDAILAEMEIQYLTISTIAIASAGTDYEIGDPVAIVGGTVYPGISSGVATVTDIDGGGGVQSIALTQGGAYTVGPGAGASTLGGNGSGLTLDCVMGIGAVLVTNPGAGYTTEPVSGFVVSDGTGAAFVGHISSPIEIAINVDATPIVFSQPSDWSGLLQGSYYDGKYSERYTITVTTGGSGATAARVRIRSASGGFSADNVVASHYGYGYIINDAALGGLAVELRPPSSSQALRVGDQFSFVVTGKYKPLSLTSNGAVSGVAVTAGGTGYGTLTTLPLVISAPPAGGTQAVGTATSGTGPTAGIIVSTEITTAGNGYTSPPLVTVGGTGTGAVFAATIVTPETGQDIALVQSGVYTGPTDTRYKITVIQGSDPDNDDTLGGAILRISDTAGIDTVQEFEVEPGVQYPIGTYGLSLTVPVNAFDRGTGGLMRGTPAGPLVHAVDGSGVVIGLNITFGGGSGYTLEDPDDPTSGPAVLFTAAQGGVGEDPPLEATSEISGGVVTVINIVNGGAGYVYTDLKVGLEPPVLFQQGFRLGDVYYVDAVAAQADGPASIMVLAGQAADITGWTEGDLLTNLFNIDIRALFTGVIEPQRDTPPDPAYEVGTAAVGGVLLKDSLSLFITERDENFQWVPVKESTNGRLFVHWRGLNPANSGDRIILYTNEADIVAKFGVDDLDNPACHGAIIAFRGAQEKPIFAARIASDDLTGYAAMLKQAERVEGIYAMAPMTLNLGIQQAFRDHVEKVSGETWKLWRRAYVGTQNIGSYVVMDTDSDDNNFTATVTGNAQGNVRVVCTTGDFLTRQIAPGDLFRINYSLDEWGTSSYEEYEIQSVLEEDELILVSGPITPITPAVKFEIWRADTGLSQALFVGNRSLSFNNRRLINVWVDSPFIHDEESEIQYVPLYYVAAEIAGLRSAVLPQQGLTYTEITNSIESAPLMFTKYTQEDLDEASRRGTFVVTQEIEDGPLFIRHQLTTKTDSGILYYEDSVGTNLDNIAYATKDIFQPYIGKRNANPETLEEIETKMRDLLDSFKRNPGGFSNIGPALANWSDLKVAIDTNFKDRINMEVTLELPLPINTIFVVLRATTIQDSTFIAFQTATLVAA